MDAPERQFSRHGEDRKQELLEQAEKLLLERGYRDTRMLDVASAAGVTKGLLYWYFESKEDLFRQIIEDVRRRSRTAISDATEAVGDDVLAQVYVGTAAAVRFVARHAELYGLIWSVEGFADARHEAAERDAIETARLIATGQRRGQIRDDEQPKLLARLNAGVVTAASLALASGSPVESTAHAAARYAVHALASSDADAGSVIAAHQPKRRAGARARSRTSRG